MKNLTLQTRVVSVKFTVDDWGLYHTAGAKQAARKLNAAFKKAVNGSLTINDARYAMHPTMIELAEFGATDSEPMWHLEDALNEVYGIE